MKTLKCASHEHFNLVAMEMMSWCDQSGEVPNWDACLTSLVAIATYTLPIGHVTSSSAIGLLSACAICCIYGKGLRLAGGFYVLLAVEF